MNDKPFEIRKADRNYQVGDMLQLEEYDPGQGDYTGCRIDAEVTALWRSSDMVGLIPGHVIMAIKVVDTITPTDGRSFAGQVENS